MRKKRFWKVLGVGVLLTSLLLFLFVAAFVFNPFEGSLPDMRTLVPRAAGFYVRKVDLRDDFADFPEPLLWEELGRSSAMRVLRGTASFRRAEQELQLERAIDELRAAAGQIRSESRGFIDLLDDVIGRDLIIAGSFRGSVPSDLGWCAYTRVSWKVRMAWGLLQWSSVQGSLRGNGIDIRPLADGLGLTVVAGGQTFHLACELDCLMVANDEGVLRASLELATRGGDSFGASADYNDGIERRLRGWAELTDLEPNAVELFLRLTDLFPLTSWDDTWPNPRHPDDMNQRVLAQFVNFRAWRHFTGSVIFEHPMALNVLGRIDMNRNDHTGFQEQFFQSEAQDRRLWLDPFLAMVPGPDFGRRAACAAAAMRMPAGEFLLAMFDSLSDAERSLLDDLLHRSGKYESARDLIGKIAPSLLPRTGFVFQRARDLGDNVVIQEPSPAPHVAWVFWIKRGMRGPLQELHDFAKANFPRLGFSNAYVLPVAHGGAAALELHTSNIPGTGMIALLLFDDFFVLSNSGPLISDLIEANLKGLNLLAAGDYRDAFEQDLPQNMNAFVYLEGRLLGEVVEDYRKFADMASSSPDSEWMASVRLATEAEVFQERFRQHGSIARIPEAEKQAFEDAVMAAMREKWGSARRQYSAADLDALDRLRALTLAFSSGYLQLSMDPHWMELTSRFLIDYR